jgi:zinc metalloprotease ZmpB
MSSGMSAVCFIRERRPFGTSPEAGAIGEGFAAYWAVTVSSAVAPTPDPACVTDWDAVLNTSEVPHYLRRVDEGLHYP